MAWPLRWAFPSLAFISALLCFRGPAVGELVFTEIMYAPGGSDALWEWVEVLNTGTAPVNLDGWIFDDDDDPAIGGATSTAANIVASPSNQTVIPAGGIAVLYRGDELNFMPDRFRAAWGSGITLIGVSSFTALAADDTIGLWASRADYNADAIAGAMTSPRRTFHLAAASFPLAGLESVATGHSIAWKGLGHATDPANWVQSQEEDGYGSVASKLTTIDNAQINSIVDRGNPGVVPAAPAANGLRITEIMFAPDSPLVTGYTSDDFEWVEIYNNRSTAIDFAATNFVLDDIAGSKLGSANIKQGSLAAGAVGVLFNGEKITLEQMGQMWGEGKNYIPVERWPALNNTGPETIGIWESYAAYNAESVSPRSFQNAVATVTYQTQVSQGWPTTSTGNSIWLHDLTGDPNSGANWQRANSASDTLSFNAMPIFLSAVDHPGGDVGSPGYVPGWSLLLPGDLDDNGVVDAADYIIWRKTDGTSDRYNSWRANFGRASAGRGGSWNDNVPEPASAMMLMLAAVLANVARVPGPSRLC